MQKQKVLLIDECEETLKCVTDILNAKYELFESRDTKTALEVISSDNRPDVILLDTSMLQTNGFEFIKSLKTDAMTSEIPVICMTNYDDSSSMERCFDTGAVDCVTKPLRRAELESKVKKYFATLSPSGFTIKCTRR